MSKIVAPYFSPGRTLVMSMVLTIVLGTGLLSLPCAHVGVISFIDLLFTASSAACVTGLFTVPLEQFTPFGQTVILLLMQLGGIGIVTMSLFFMSLFMDFGLSTQLMARHVLELESWKNIRKLLIFSIGVTFLCELIGAIGIFVTIGSKLPPSSALFLSVFHAVSAFCNAGISLFRGPYASFATHPVVMVITAVLLFAGGLGFITWHEIVRCMSARGSATRRRFSLHSSIVLHTACVLFIVSAVAVWLLERNHLFVHLTAMQTFLQVVFYAVSFRGGGFLLTTPQALQLGTLVLIMVRSFIGSSPGSTGSGVKITTVAIFLATIRSVLLGRTAVEIHGRQIALDQVLKAGVVIALTFCWIMITIFCLSVTETEWSFLAIVSEAFAASTNLGISVGDSASLSVVGKSLIIASMFIGRLGAVSFILALRLRRTRITRMFSYPEERVMLG